VGLVDQSIDVLLIGAEPFFSGTVDSFNSVDDYVKCSRVLLVYQVSPVGYTLI
jgi:hypothetical protein